MPTEVLNLGLVKAIHVGLTPPLNNKLLWYDDNAGVKVLKYYNTSTLTWTLVSTQVVDNLTSTDSAKALSANQGRVLKGLVDTINAQLDGAIDGTFGGVDKTLSISFTNGLATSVSSNNILITSSQVSDFNTSVDSRINVQKGVANGLASLDPAGKVPFSQLPSTLLIYKGVWNLSTNTPPLSDGTGTTGWTYRVTGAPTPTNFNFGSGNILLTNGDYIIYNDTGIWEKSDGSDAVTSVNGKQGTVVLVTDDIAESISPSNLWFTNARARGAISENIVGIIYNSTTGEFTLDSGYLIPNRDSFAGISTGLRSGGALNINADTTKFDLAAGSGTIIDETNPNSPTITNITWSAFSAQTATYLATHNSTFIGINSSGAIVQQTTPFTEQQRRSIIQIGAIIHSNRTVINVVNNFPTVINSTTSQLHDLMSAVGAFNISGNKYSPNGTNLNLNKSAGHIFKLGSNFDIDINDPHTRALSGGVSLTFRYRLQNGTEYTDTTTIDPDYYDLAGVRTIVPNNKFTIQRINVFQSGITRLQYGQSIYSTMAEAKNAIANENFSTEDNIAQNGLLRGFLIIKKGTTNLSNLTDAEIIEASRFGDTSVGAAAGSTTNLQQAYNNSVEPEILTNSTLGAVSFRRGSASDGDDVVEILNGAGTQVFAVKGNGQIITASLTTSSGSFDVLTRNSITGIIESKPSSYYAVDSSVVHKAGAETITGVKTFDNDIFIGLNRIGQGFTIGNNNVVFGNGAGANITSNDMIAIGRQSMGNGTGGPYSIGIGLNTLFYSTGAYNVAIGSLAMQQNTTGERNVALGNQALFVNTTGSDNFALGFSSLTQNTTGTGNVGLGYGTLSSNISGGGNVAIGTSSLTNSLGDLNVGVGYNTLGSNTTGHSNTAIGSYVLRLNTIGAENTAIGNYAGWSNTTGVKNTFIGQSAGYTNTTGSHNIVIGSANLPTVSESFSLLIADGLGNVRIYSPSTQNIILGGVTDDGVNKLQINGSAKINGNLYIGTNSDIQFTSANYGILSADGNRLAIIANGLLTVNGKFRNAGSLTNRYIEAYADGGYLNIGSTNGESSTFSYKIDNKSVFAESGADSTYMTLVPNSYWTRLYIEATTIINDNLILGSGTDDLTNKLQVTGSGFFTDGLGLLNSGSVSGTAINISGTTSAKRLLHIGTTGADSYIGTSSSVGSSLVTGSDPYSLEFRNDIGFIFGLGTVSALKINSSGTTFGGSMTSSGQIKSLNSLAVESTNPYLELTDSTTGAVHYIVGGDTGVSIQADSTGSSASSFIEFKIDGTKWFDIVSTGAATFSNTLTANGQLAINKAAGGTIAVFSNTTDADVIITATSGVAMISPSTNALALGTNSSEKMRIVGGNVGIGTTSPLSKLSIAGSGGALSTTSAIQFYDNNSAGSRNFAWSNGAGSNTTDLIGKFVLSVSSALNGDALTGSALMTVTSAGNVLIGTTTDNSSGAKLQIAGATTMTGNLALLGTDSRINGGDSAGRLIVGNSSTETYIGLYGTSHTTVPNIMQLVVNNAVALSFASTQLATFSSSVIINESNLIGVSSVGSDGGVIPRLAIGNPSNADKFVGILYDNSYDTGFIHSIHRATAWKNIAIQAFGGQVLIGTPTASTANDKMQIHSAGATTLRITGTDNTLFRGIVFGSVLADSTEYAYIKYQPQTGEFRFWGSPSAFGGFTTFYNNGSEMLRFNTANRIITNSATDTGEHFIVGGSARINGTLRSTDSIAVFSSAYPTNYGTSLRSDASANGILQLGNNGTNYILAGNSSAGGTLVIKTNVTDETLTTGSEIIRFNSGGSIVTNSAANTGEHFIVGGSARVNGNTYLNGATTPLTIDSSTAYTSFRIDNQTVNAAYRNWAITNSANNSGDLSFFVSSAQGGNPISGTIALNIASTGAATFSSSVTANGILTINTGTANQNAKIFGNKIGFSRVSDAAEVVYFSKNTDLGVEGTANINGYDGIQFRTQGAETIKMTIVANGNVLIGTTTDNGYKTQINGSVYANGEIKIASGNNLTLSGGDIQWQSNAGFGILSANSNRLMSIQNGLLTVNGVQVINTAANSSWALTIDNAGTTNANGLYVNIGTSSTGVPFRVDKGGSALFSIANSGTATFSKSVSINESLSIIGGIIPQVLGLGSTDTTAYNPTTYNGASARAIFSGGNATGAFNGIEFTGGSNNENFLGFVQESGGAAAFVIQGYTGSAYIEKFRITSGGNIGLGTNNPLNKLTSVATTTYNVENSYAIAAASGVDSAYKLIIGYDTSLDAGVISSVRTSVGWKSTYINPNGGIVNIGDTLSMGSNNILFNESGVRSWNIQAGSAKLNIWSGDELGSVSIRSGLDVKLGTNLITRNKALTLDNFTGDGVGITFTRTTSDDELMAIGVADSEKLGLFSRAGLIFATGGATTYSATTERMRILESGYVGIGSPSPSQILHVKDAIPYLNIQTGSAGTSGAPIYFGIKFSNYADLQRASIEAYDRSFDDNTGMLRFSTTSAAGTFGEAMRITGDKNVGIGTASPSALLDVGGGYGNPTGTQFSAVIKGTSGRVIYFDGSTGSASVWWGSGNTPQFAIDSISGGGASFWSNNGSWSEKMRIVSNGNILLGTTTDNGKKLQVNGDVSIATIANATVSTDKFLVSDSGVVKYRTGAELLVDIGAAPSSGSSSYIQNQNTAVQSSSSFWVANDSKVEGRFYIGTNGCYIQEVLVGSTYELRAFDSAGNSTILT